MVKRWERTIQVIASGDRKWIMKIARDYKKAYPLLKFKIRKTKYIMYGLKRNPRRYEIITTKEQRYKHFI